MSGLFGMCRALRQRPEDPGKDGESQEIAGLKEPVATIRIGSEEIGASIRRDRLDGHLPGLCDRTGLCR
jgi:hypothetical protein